MRRLFLCIMALLGISTCAVAQTSQSDTQALQALLSEVRALRQELRGSLNRAQGMQILLARFQIQEGVITRASDHLNEARQKLLDTHLHQKELALELKRLEDSLNSAESPPQQADLQDRIKHVKSGIEFTGNIAQQQETAEIQAQQQLREEQEKLNALESQLDSLIRTTANPGAKSSSDRP